ncbi:MAG: hypothetical protein JZU65_16200, partial [Chlorobium sp.]|nr:hypothetical protein [Chlorobium sp.]
MLHGRHQLLRHGFKLGPGGEWRRRKEVDKVEHVAALGLLLQQCGRSTSNGGEIPFNVVIVGILHVPVIQPGDAG